MLMNGDELGVIETWSGDYNFYLWNAPMAGDWTRWDALSRNPSPLARDFCMLPSGNNTMALSAPAMGLPSPTP